MPAIRPDRRCEEKQVSRGLAVGDLFNDGNMDVVVERPRWQSHGLEESWSSWTPLGEL